MPKCKERQIIYLLLPLHCLQYFGHFSFAKIEELQSGLDDSHQLSSVLEQMGSVKDPSGKLSGKIGIPAVCKLDQS